MRIAFIGGTGPLGATAVPLARHAGHVVLVAHRGVHGLDDDVTHDIEHVHGPRAELLDTAGPVASWHPDVIVDTFAGATTEKAHELVGCARACAARVVALSSCDVYQASLDAGMGDGRYRSTLSAYRLPISEDAPLRSDPFPLPDGFLPFDHDNAAMERVLQTSGLSAVVLRPGMIYGSTIPPERLREGWIVAKIVRGEHRLELPWQGTQLFSRVAIERVARAVLAAVTLEATGLVACNVVDPYGWTFAGLAAEIGRILEWEWQPVETNWVNPFSDDPARHHPFSVPSPCWYSDARLRTELGVGPDEPDPLAALEETVRWLWRIARAAGS